MDYRIRRVAVIGAGPSGAIATEALLQEAAFDEIRVFERRERSGGCWIAYDGQPAPIANLTELANRTADKPLDVPKELPCFAAKPTQPRFAESSIYPYLETNVDAKAMEFSQEMIAEERSEWTKSMHGEHSPFRPWQTLRRYVEELMNDEFVSYNTTVERAEKVGEVWQLTLRKDADDLDYWWTEEFDAVVVASGHFSVPFIPKTKGLEEFENSRPGSVLHSKHYRGRDNFKGKRVVVVGASVSAADISVDLVKVTQSPVHSVVLGHTANVYFGDEAFHHPKIRMQPTIKEIVGRNVIFEDGAIAEDVDHIIFGTGYSWSLPFLPSVQIRNNRIPDLYQHIVWQNDPTLLFVGAVGAGLTFKIFEWQAVYAARLLAGRGTLPSVEKMRQWESDRIRCVGDGPKFSFIHPHFEEYFTAVKQLAGEPVNGVGRPLPDFDREWFTCFMDGCELRKDMWRRINVQARDTELQAKDPRPSLRAQL